MKILILFLLIENSFGRSCDLKKFNMYGEGYENQMYILRKEKEVIKYRGIASTRADAVETFFQDIKKGICPDILPKL